MHYEAPPAGSFREEVENVKIWFSGPYLVNTARGANPELELVNQIQRSWVKPNCLRAKNNKMSLNLHFMKTITSPVSFVSNTNTTKIHQLFNHVLLD